MATQRKTNRASAAPHSGQAASPRSASQAERRPYGSLALLALAAVLAILAGVYFWPTASDELPEIALDASSVPADGEIQLPSTPAERTVKELRNEAERAVVALRQRYPQSAGALHVAAMHYAAINQHQKAADLWREAIELDPKHAGPRVGMARAAMERGADAEAVAILEAALAAGCDTSEIYRELGSALQKIGQLSEAETRTQEGVRRYPQDAELWAALGQVQLQQDNLEAAATSFQQAIQHDPNSATAHFALANVFARQGKKEEAEIHRQRFAEIKKRHPLQEHRFQVVYEAALRRLVVGTLRNVGAEHQKQGALQDAENFYLQALRLDPADRDACRWLASLYHDAGRLADARLVQQRLVEIEPERIENHLNLASLAARLGEPEAVEQILRSAQDAAPQSAIIPRTLASLYLQQGRSDEARAAAEQAVQRDPSAESYLVLATACEQLGDVAAAAQAKKAARRMAPQSPPTRPVAP